MNIEKLYFGKDDAERDFTSSGLLKAGFLRTTIYEAAKSRTKSLIIGRKGSGKSAICLMLHEALSKEKNAFSSIITPDAISADELRRFEMTGVNDEQAKKLVWRYIFLVQVSKFLIEAARKKWKKESDWTDEIKKIRQFLVENGEVDDLNFQEKFWRIINRIKASITISAFNQEIEVESGSASEGLRLGTKLEFLEKYLKQQLASFDKYKLYLFIDKVDEIWNNDPWSDQMVIGLLMAAKEINEVFPNIACICFLRADIYDMLQFHDRDKFRGDEAHISWTNEKLEELVLARANASTNQQLTSTAFWAAMFPSSVEDVSINKWLLDKTLKRPRDVIQLCNLCVDNARMNGRKVVTDKDIKDALEIYSNWKLMDLMGEYKINYPFLNDLLILFSNTSFVANRQRFDKVFAQVKPALEERYPDYKAHLASDAILNILYGIGFIGTERAGRTVFYYEDPRTIEVKDKVFVVHPAFRNALKCVSSIDIRPYARTEGREDEGRYIGEIMRGRSPIRGAFERVDFGRDFERVGFRFEALS